MMALHPAVLEARRVRRKAGLPASLTSAEVLARIVATFRHPCPRTPDDQPVPDVRDMT